MKLLLSPYFRGTISGSGAASTAPTLTGIGGSDMAKRICSITGCERKVLAGGWCSAHYQRWQKHGSPVAGGTFAGLPLKSLTAILQVDTTECVIWPFSCNAGGYGQIGFNGKVRRVHVIVCEHHHGARPTPKHEVAHSCGNRPCANWRHLRWATRSENQQDKLIHGTHHRGEQSASVKLTADQVREIRKRVGNERNVDIARDYGVRPPTISSIANRRTWRWLDTPPSPKEGT